MIVISGVCGRYNGIIGVVGSRRSFRLDIFCCYCENREMRGFEVDFGSILGDIGNNVNVICHLRIDINDLKLIEIKALGKLKGNGEDHILGILGAISVFVLENYVIRFGYLHFSAVDKSYDIISVYCNDTNIVAKKVACAVLNLYVYAALVEDIFILLDRRGLGYDLPFDRMRECLFRVQKDIAILECVLVITDNYNEFLELCDILSYFGCGVDAIGSVSYLDERIRLESDKKNGVLCFIKFDRLTVIIPMNRRRVEGRLIYLHVYACRRGRKNVIGIACYRKVSGYGIVTGEQDTADSSTACGDGVIYSNRKIGRNGIRYRGSGMRRTVKGELNVARPSEVSYVYGSRSDSNGYVTGSCADISVFGNGDLPLIYGSLCVLKGHLKCAVKVYYSLEGRAVLLIPSDGDAVKSLTYCEGNGMRLCIRINVGNSYV